MKKSSWILKIGIPILLCSFSFIFYVGYDIYINIGNPELFWEYKIYELNKKIEIDTNDGTLNWNIKSMILDENYLYLLYNTPIYLLSNEEYSLEDTSDYIWKTDIDFDKFAFFHVYNKKSNMSYYLNAKREILDVRNEIDNSILEQLIKSNSVSIWEINFQSSYDFESIKTTPLWSLEFNLHQYFNDVNDIK